MTAPELSPAELAIVARFDAAPVPPEVAAEVVALLLDEVRETVGVGALVTAAQREGLYCCSVGCGSGGCETCPCCCAGWCVSGLDGLPEDSEDRARWLEVSAEHNPLAAAIAAMPPSPAEEAVKRVEALAESLSWLVEDETVDQVARVSHAWTLRRIRAALASPAPAPHVHGAWCHPSADGCPDRPGM